MDGSIILVFFLLTIPFLLSLRNTEFTREDKQNYMNSQKWQNKRQEILARDDYKCKSCKTRIGLEIHHITYKRLGNERKKDLITLCRRCHQKVHDKYGYSYSSTFPIN